MTDNKRDSVLNIRLSAVEREKIAIAAELAGRPMARWTREVAISAAEQAMAIYSASNEELPIAEKPTQEKEQ